MTKSLAKKCCVNVSKLAVMLTLIGLYLGCNEDNPALTAPTVPMIDTIFYRVNVDRLRMRNAPGLSSETVTLLPEGALVKYWSEHSTEKTTVTLRDSSISQYWFMISYADTVGWVFGGALLPLAAESGEDHIIVPGKRVGGILAADSEQDIIDRLGPDQVERGEFMIGEGEFVQATFVYPASDKELILLWHEVDFVQLREVRIRRSESPWITEQGIKVGSTLREVEEINQGPFLLSGFGWDYAGSTLDWQRGILQSNLALVFAEPEKMHKSLLGDQSFSSDHKRMHAANPVVKTMRILFSI